MGVRLTWCVVVRFGGNRLCCVTRPHPEALYTETGEFRVMDHITCRIIASELEAAVCVERSVAGVRVIQSIQNFNTLNVILFHQLRRQSQMAYRVRGLFLISSAPTTTRCLPQGSLAPQIRPHQGRVEASTVLVQEYSEHFVIYLAQIIIA